MTEAVPAAPEALVNSARPRSRPEGLTPPEAPPAPADTVAEITPPEPVEPEPEPQPDPEPAPTENLQSQLEALVASANNATAPTAPTQTEPTPATAVRAQLGHRSRGANGTACGLRFSNAGTFPPGCGTREN